LLWPGKRNLSGKVADWFHVDEIRAFHELPSGMSAIFQAVRVLTESD
jgi:hypothetical protein